MKKVVAFMHLSLDGYVAGPNGEMDWITVDEDIFDYAGIRTSESDLALYGRVTYELMESYWPTAADQPNASRHDIEHSKWYKKVEKVIISRTMKDARRPNTTIIHDNLSANIRSLKQGTEKDIVLFGSPSIVRALTADHLIDHYWLFVNPILLGKGIKLFDPIPNAIPLRLVTSKIFPSGVVCLDYEANGSK
jgi:dihydrofolate reductase